MAMFSTHEFVPGHAFPPAIGVREHSRVEVFASKAKHFIGRAAAFSSKHISRAGAFIKEKPAYAVGGTLGAFALASAFMLGHDSANAHKEQTAAQWDTVTSSAIAVANAGIEATANPILADQVSVAPTHASFQEFSAGTRADLDDFVIKFGLGGIGVVGAGLGGAAYVFSQRPKQALSQA
jgi:hypothetical protein